MLTEESALSPTFAVSTASGPVAVTITAATVGGGEMLVVRVASSTRVALVTPCSAFPASAASVEPACVARSAITAATKGIEGPALLVVVVVRIKRFATRTASPRTVVRALKESAAVSESSSSTSDDDATPGR